MGCAKIAANHPKIGSEQTWGICGTWDEALQIGHAEFYNLVPLLS